MGKVFQLFKQKTVEAHSDPKIILTISVADILASTTELARTVEELSGHLDTVDHFIDELTDADIRARFKQLARPVHERLMNTSVELSQQVKKLSLVQQQLAEAFQLSDAIHSRNSGMH